MLQIHGSIELYTSASVFAESQAMYDPYCYICGQNNFFCGITNLHVNHTMHD